MSKNQVNKFKGQIKPLIDPDRPALNKAADGVRLVFSHRYITNGSYCLKKCSIEQFRSLADKLRILSELEWKTIDSSPRETNGFEMLPVGQIAESLPAIFEKEHAVMVFRFGGQKGGRLVGIKKENCFFVLFIDHNFTFYKH